MKKMVYLLLIVLLISGCGAKTKNKKEYLPIKYQNISYNYKSIDENRTRVSTIIKNTSENDGKIYNIAYAVKTKDGVLQNGELLNKSYEIKKDEELLITFDVEYNIDNISSVIVTAFDNKNEPIEYYQTENVDKFNNFSDSINDIVLKTSKKIAINLSLKEEINSGSMKLSIYSNEDEPLCIAYNYPSKIVSDKEYVFKCNNEINLENAKISLYYK